MAEDKISMLGPWKLKLVSIGDDISHAIAETTYPYKNGADLEDMGVNPEGLKFSCALNNEDYDNNYEPLHKWFLSIFKEPVELVHPKFGTLKGYPKNSSFNEDRRRRHADFTFEFEVANIQPDIQSYSDPYASNFEEAVALNEDVVAEVALTMQQTGVPDIAGSSDWSLLDVWASLGDKARNFAEATSKAMGKMLGAIEEVKAPLDAISTSIDYVDSLSGTLAKAIQGCCDSFVAVSRKVTARKGKSRASVATLVSDLSTMLASLNEAPASVQASFATIAASTIATETAKLISDDEKKMGESIAAEGVELDDAEGRPLADEKTPYLLTPADLEDTLAMSRAFIQKVLPIAISPYRLKKQAATLSDAVLRLKMEYMTTKTLKLSHDTPLHKIALDNGLNYKAAERLCALNDVKNPTFMNGEVLVYES